MTTLTQKYKPYPAYQPSAVQWLGQIPAHWDVKRLKFVARIAAGQSPPSEMVTQDMDALPFLQGNAEFGAMYPIPRFTCEEPPKSSWAGDILLSVRAPVGAINIADQPYGIGRGLCAIQPSVHLEGQFTYYLLLVVRSCLSEMATGSTYDAVTGGDVGSVPAILPPLPEQTAIAAFLDRETARIDALVARKERLIELLQEKRAALITRAVTRGLNPNAPMKDSGVQWLGEIPAHWEVKRLKYVATINDEALAETNDPDMTITYVDIGNVDSVKGITGAEELLFEDAPSRARRIVREGDVIISTVRTYLRAIARIEPTNTNLIVSTGFAVIRPRQLHDGFIAYALGSPYFVDRVVAHSVGVSYPAINANELACLDIAFPSILEQQAIAAFLDQETAKLDSLVAKVREAIERLNEFRAALISAAVTGRIDVREDAGCG